MKNTITYYYKAEHRSGITWWLKSDNEMKDTHNVTYYQVSKGEYDKGINAWEGTGQQPLI